MLTALHENQGLIEEWDLLNEPYDNRDLMKILGEDVVLDWFGQARAQAPQVDFYINDYDNLGYPNAPHAKFFISYLKGLIDKGADFQGIGLQSHFKEEVTSPVQIYEHLNKLAVLGKKIRITEHDFISDSEEFQAEFMRDFLTVCFSHPDVYGITQWGFWAGAHWRSRAALFTESWDERPNLQAYKDLVFNQWWSRGSVQVNSDGQVKIRVFKGDYLLKVYSKNNQLIKTLKLSFNDADQDNLIEL